MAVFKTTVYFLAVLMPIAIIKCQDIPGLPTTPGLPSTPGPSSIPGLSSFPGIPSFPGLSTIRGQRQTPVPDQNPDHNGGRDHHDRFFFNFFPSSVSCNYNTEGGRTCRSCNQAMTCNENNIGYLRRCHGFFPYCNSGACSLFPGAACKPTTSTASTSMTSTPSTTTAATGR